jgi:mono/diheme cytochrome c family protein
MIEGIAYPAPLSKPACLEQGGHVPVSTPIPSRSAMRLPILFVAAVLSCAPTSSARSAGDAEAGRQIAATWCAPCHAALGQGPTSDIAPAFGWIVENRSVAGIAGFLAEPHGRMPNIQLSRQQIDDLVAYIESWKRR